MSKESSREWSVESASRFNLPAKFSYNPNRVPKKTLIKKKGVSPKKSIRFIQRYDSNHVCTGAVSPRCKHNVIDGQREIRESENDLVRQCKRCVVAGIAGAKFCAQHVKYNEEHSKEPLVIRCTSKKANGNRCLKNALSSAAIGGPKENQNAKCAVHGGSSVNNPRRKN